MLHAVLGLLGFCRIVKSCCLPTKFCKLVKFVKHKKGQENAAAAAAAVTLPRPLAAAPAVRAAPGLSVDLSCAVIVRGHHGACPTWATPASNLVRAAERYEGLTI